MDKLDTDKQKPLTAAEANGEVLPGKTEEVKREADTLPPLRQGDIMRAAQDQTRELREQKAQDIEQEEKSKGDPKAEKAEAKAEKAETLRADAKR